MSGGIISVRTIEVALAGRSSSVRPYRVPSSAPGSHLRTGRWLLSTLPRILLGLLLLPLATPALCAQDLEELEALFEVAYAGDDNPFTEILAVEATEDLEELEALLEVASQSEDNLLTDALTAIQQLEAEQDDSARAVLGTQALEAVQAFYAAAAQEAAEAFRSAAEQGLAEAQFGLGIMYEWGMGVPLDDAEAARWFRLAAEQGLAEAQLELADRYDFGVSGPLDDAEAARWFRLAAEQGLAEAQRKLGNRYHYGEGVLTDEFEAARWYQRAAEQGDIDALHSLGFLYSNGEGELEDGAEAVRWFRLFLPAERGNTLSSESDITTSIGLAAYHLGGMYTTGVGVLKDLVQAHLWLNVASANGFVNAGRDRDNLERDMTRDDISHATELARRCMGSDYQECGP